MEADKLTEIMVRSLDTHKAEDIRVIGVTELTSLADYFVIASGTSATQVRALADYLEKELGEQGVPPQRIEGYAASNWILMDYGTVVVHIFGRDTRAFYDLERLWKDGRPIDVAGYLANGGNL